MVTDAEISLNFVTVDGKVCLPLSELFVLVFQMRLKSES